MLVKLLFWILLFYFGSRALFKWAAGNSKSKEEKSSVKGEPKQRQMPYNPDDIVDAHYHDAPDNKDP
ncbi:MAG: hypothetical protein V2A56_03785 [bacterium]